MGTQSLGSSGEVVRVVTVEVLGQRGEELKHGRDHRLARRPSGP